MGKIIIGRPFPHISPCLGPKLFTSPQISSIASSTFLPPFFFLFSETVVMVPLLHVLPSVFYPQPFLIIPRPCTCKQDCLSSLCVDFFSPGCKRKHAFFFSSTFFFFILPPSRSPPVLLRETNPRIAISRLFPSQCYMHLPSIAFQGVFLFDTTVITHFLFC